MKTAILIATVSLLISCNSKNPKVQISTEFGDVILEIQKQKDSAQYLVNPIKIISIKREE